MGSSLNNGQGEQGGIPAAVPTVRCLVAFPKDHMGFSAPGGAERAAQIEYQIRLALQARYGEVKLVLTSSGDEFKQSFKGNWSGWPHAIMAPSALTGRRKYDFVVVFGTPGAFVGKTTGDLALAAKAVGAGVMGVRPEGAAYGLSITLWDDQNYREYWRITEQGVDVPEIGPGSPEAERAGSESRECVVSEEDIFG